MICNLSNFLCFGQFDAIFRSFRSIHHTSDDTGDPRRRGSIKQGSIVKRERKKKIIFQQTVIKEENEIDGKQKRKKKQMNIEYKEQKTDDNDVSKLW